MKYIIIGGVAGGATAATRIRRNDEHAEIILLEKGNYISYANCGLPYYIGDVITEREKLLLQTPQSFKDRFNIDIRIQNEVVGIDTSVKSVSIRTQEGNIYQESYDKLLLSPGANPIRPNLTGIEDKRIFTLRNVNDTDAIKSYINNNHVKKAVIVGAGFIGLEMAENLHHLGLEISIVEMANQVMAPLDFSMASLIHTELQQKGIGLYLGEAVKGFEEKGAELQVQFNSGSSLTTDLVILAIGVRPATALATQSNLQIGEMGGIKVNEYLQTSDESVYAVGDVIEYPHPVSGKPWLNYLAGPANRQARIVADNMCFGNNIRYEGSIGTGIAKVFDLTVATTGLPAKRLKQAQIAYVSSTTHGSSHAGYYPGASNLTIKITFEPTTGRLLGAQIVGYEGVDKRIDEFALVIKQKGTIYDLESIEHAYAPPFSSAKDPVAIAGYTAENILRKKVFPIYWRELSNKQDAYILDVRTKDEFEFGAISGAVNIPLNDLRKRINEIPTHREIIVYCAVGLRGYVAARILQQEGFNQVMNLSGGYKTFKAATQTIVNKKIKIQGNMPLSPKTDLAVKVDACGLQCPGPILKMKQTLDKMKAGERVEMIATDPGFPIDAQSWCETTGNLFLNATQEKGQFTVTIEKKDKKTEALTTSAQGKGKTFILFSDDLDKALATFVLANGAVATGEKVTIFFTFWGLNALKSETKPTLKKDIFGRMFGMMLPAHSKKLKLSQMNMGGLGAKMMRFIMKRKGVDSLESLRQQALDNGVEFIACQMSMDVMGVKKEEMIDQVTIGGVATYMQRANQSNINLFI